jgi:hypothetical protein
MRRPARADLKGLGNVRGRVVATSPAWCAVIVQLPAPVNVTLVLLMLHCPLAVNVTCRPDEAAALMLKGGSPALLFGSGAKLSV